MHLEEKKEIKHEIITKGYETLRVSIFDNYRHEWCTCIEYDDISNQYFVFARADRAGLLGDPYQFDDFRLAKQKFLKLLDLEIKINRRYVSEGIEAPYHSPLWDTE